MVEKIIDSHMHLGVSRAFGLEQTESDLLEAFEENDVDGAIVQPYPRPEKDEKTIHGMIKEFADEHELVKGQVSLDPHRDEDEYKSLARELIDSGFVSIKLHTIGHAINPMVSDAEKVFEIGRELDIPVNVHTGPGVPFALPSHVLPRAEEFSDVDIVLNHAGWDAVYATEALIVADHCDNVFLEPSWCSPWMKSILYENLGADRLLFGSDDTINQATELFMWRDLDIPKSDLEKILFKNAEKLYFK